MNTNTGARFALSETLPLKSSRQLADALAMGRAVYAVLAHSKRMATVSLRATEAEAGRVRVEHFRELWIDFDSPFVECWVAKSATVTATGEGDHVPT